MESNHKSLVPTNSNGERASNIQENFEPNNIPVISYHKRYPDEEYFPTILSPGYGFSPEDDVLIVDYLNKEINKEDAPYIRIPKVNVYNHTPEELAESHQSMGKDEWYFFSPRERKYLNGSRPNRAAGNGFWKATGADKRIYRNGKSVGSKKCLVFYGGKPKQSNKTTWIMHEYVADQPQRQRLPNVTGDMRLDDCVLCRIYKKSEYSPKEETEAAASQSGETAKPAARKSSENKKQAAPRRVKTEHEGTNQQQCLPVMEPNLQMQQQNIPVIQPSLPTQQQNHQVMQYRHWPWSDNLGGQLHFRPERIPEEAKPLQPNIPTSQQNPQAIMQNSRQPWSNNLGGQLDFSMERNPEEAQRIMLQPNFRTPQRNPQATQYPLQAGSYDLGGQLDFSMESTPEEANQHLIDNLGNNHETFGDSIPMDTVGNITFPAVFQNGLRYNDFYHHLPPMDSFDPIPPSFGNNDHPQNGSLIQGDHELVFPKAGTSGNAYNNPREKS